MQTANATLQAGSLASLRELAWGVSFSFDKTLLPGTSFFTIGVSLIGGSDFIKGSGDVVQEWDK